ncbi:FtsX-like permease family protein [Streptomyces sp. NPDC055078]
MKTWYRSWRAAIRIARRDAWRNKGRSVLVLAMLALPIVGVSAADLTIRSGQLSPEQKLQREMGRADARVTDPQYGGVPVLQSPDGEASLPPMEYENKPLPEGGTDVAKALPAGATTLTDTLGRAKLRTGHGLLNTEIRELKAADPMSRGIMTLLDGRFPKKADEVAVTSQFLKNSGLELGSGLSARGLDRQYTIVGTYELPGLLKTDQVNLLPGALLAPLDQELEKAGLPTTGPETSYLVKIKGGFTWNMVKQVNAKGVTVASRAVILDPPPRSDVPFYDVWHDYGNSSSAQATVIGAVATVVGLAMLEICLLAGPAFAVGARRSRRQLGLVGANGGDRRHIRAIVLSGGLVLGAVAAVVGTALGLLLTWALRPVIEDYAGERFASFDIRPLELLGIGLLAVLTGLLAALVPAVTASRQSVLASLTGRRGVRRTSRVLPTIGLIAVALGAAIALYGSTVSDSVLLVGGGSALAELGVVALTPALVGLFGKTGRFLPLSPRLALRDAVRNRGRTAPAVAAVLAAVAGTVAVATYAASQNAQEEAAYEARLPRGAVSVTLDEADSAREIPGVRSTVQKMLPVDVRADVDRIAVGKPNCATYDDSQRGCGRYELIIPPANECPLRAFDPADPDADPAAKYSVAERRKLSRDWRCQDPKGYAAVNVMIGDEKLLKVLGIEDKAVAKALAGGKTVAFDHRHLNTKGEVGIRLITDPAAADEAAEKRKESPGEVKVLPAHRAPKTVNAYGIQLLMSPATAKAAGLTTTPLGAYYSTDKTPGTEQRQKLEGELDKTGGQVDLHVEEGFTSENSIILLALAVFAGLITIGAAGIATGLAQADAEADLKTLAAVGAPPRVRRTLSGFQCGVVALMGVVLGSAAGVLPAMGLRLTERQERMHWHQKALDAGHGDITVPYVPIVVPWSTLAVLLIAVPLGAALLAALVTRSRGALARREAT